MTDKRDEAETNDIPPGALALDQQLCFAVYSAAHAMNRTYKPLLDPYGLTYPQYIVLMALWEEDGRTVKALGETLGLDSGTLSPLLKRLEAAGHIRRARDKADERQVLITLTDKGKAMQGAAIGILKAIGQATGCTVESVRSLTGELQRLTARLEAAARHDTAA
ncbi:MarR family winged helix-turn-helix transcriptional regulator [Shinella oryzae]|uniref:MarR family winged helix-turn-helix transcriptional regulator n=1 Tax=Shinella oryzae TaxID=2871820 RepID=UPI001FF601C5|nr:MarR family transcriptional regulator [Shinella oryzae]UPA25278.1 MarR family transcriptional regulator [Shinella oryzae]